MDPQPSSNLYFIAVLPDAATQQEVTRFKEYAASEFGSRHALRSPPHVTLFPPFRWQRADVPRLEESLRSFATGEQAFSMELKGFDCFASRVIFVDIVENQALAGLQGRLRKHLEQTVRLHSGDDRPFHPHMTVAFKDLRRSVFPEAWAYFSKIGFERRFTIGSVMLLRHVDGKWEPAREFSFKGGNT